jgi:hypothetical protein
MYVANVTPKDRAHSWEHKVVVGLEMPGATTVSREIRAGD